MVLAWWAAILSKPLTLGFIRVRLSVEKYRFAKLNEPKIQLFTDDKQSIPKRFNTMKTTYFTAGTLALLLAVIAAIAGANAFRDSKTSTAAAQDS